MTVAMSTLHPIENGAFPLGEGGRGSCWLIKFLWPKPSVATLTLYNIVLLTCHLLVKSCWCLVWNWGNMVLKEMLLGFIHNLHRYWWALIKQKGHPLNVQQSTISVSPFRWQAHSDARSNQKKWGTRPSKLEEPAEWLAPTVGQSPFSQLQLHQMLLLWPTLYQTLLGSTSSCEIQKKNQTPHISWCLILCKDWYNTELGTSLTYFAFDSKGLAEQLTWLALQ